MNRTWEAGVQVRLRLRRRSISAAQSAIRAKGKMVKSASSS